MKKNNDDFNVLKKLIEEINKALNDESMMNFEDGEIKETLVGAAGTAAGAAIGVGGLIAGGTTGLSAAGITSGLAAAGSFVGGGMVAGIAVLAAPAVILGTGGVLLASKINKNRIKNQKLILLKECLVKLRALYNEIKNTSKNNQERISYLMQLISLLKRYIYELEKEVDKNKIAGQLTILDEVLEPAEDKDINEINKNDDKDNEDKNNRNEQNS